MSEDLECDPETSRLCYGHGVSNVTKKVYSSAEWQIRLLYIVMCCSKRVLSKNLSGIIINELDHPNM